MVEGEGVQHRGIITVCVMLATIAEIAPWEWQHD
jgi:hypothetical protein